METTPLRHHVPHWHHVPHFIIFTIIHFTSQIIVEHTSLNGVYYRQLIKSIASSVLSTFTIGKSGPNIQKTKSELSLCVQASVLGRGMRVKKTLMQTLASQLSCKLSLLNSRSRLTSACALVFIQYLFLHNRIRWRDVNKDCGRNVFLVLINLPTNHSVTTGHQLFQTTGK